MSEGIWLPQDEYDLLCEQVNAGEQARRERENLQRALQVALGKIDALEVELDAAQETAAGWKRRALQAER